MDPSVVGCMGSLIVLVDSQSSSLLGPASWKGCWLQVSGTVVKRLFVESLGSPELILAHCWTGS